MHRAMGVRITTRRVARTAKNVGVGDRGALTGCIERTAELLPSLKQGSAVMLASSTVPKEVRVLRSHRAQLRMVYQTSAHASAQAQLHTRNDKPIFLGSSTALGEGMSCLTESGCRFGL